MRLKASASYTQQDTGPLKASQLKSLLSLHGEIGQQGSPYSARAEDTDHSMFAMSQIVEKPLMLRLEELYHGVTKKLRVYSG